jgi:hypothetical protein
MPALASNPSAFTTEGASPTPVTLRPPNHFQAPVPTLTDAAYHDGSCPRTGEALIPGGREQTAVLKSTPLDECSPIRYDAMHDQRHPVRATTRDTGTRCVSMNRSLLHEGRVLLRPAAHAKKRHDVEAEVCAGCSLITGDVGDGCL